MFHDETTRAIWLSAAQTLHFMQCLDALESDEPEAEPYMCPEWMARDYARKRKHRDPSELEVSEIPLSAFRAARALVCSTLALSWEHRDDEGMSIKLPSSFEGILWAEDDPDTFGYKLAMQAMGHGVGMFDYYPDPPRLKAPDVHYYGPYWELDERFA
uniref:Uncharacterized protein n=1 Tax=viral metagenome TaxID=1070528 RepID=A0A6M3XVQ3_9ZZZZ